MRDRGLGGWERHYSIVEIGTIGVRIKRDTL